MKDKNTKNLRKSMNRGSVEHGTKVADYEGEIMTLAKKEVISIPPTKTIKEAAEMMIEHGFRRLPVTHPGSNKLLGIVTAMDILDFLGIPLRKSWQEKLFLLLLNILLEKV